jgi:hypothetical protein
VRGNGWSLSSGFPPVKKKELRPLFFSWSLSSGSPPVKKKELRPEWH